MRFMPLAARTGGEGLQLQRSPPPDPAPAVEWLVVRVHLSPTTDGFANVGSTRSRTSEYDAEKIR